MSNRRKIYVQGTSGVRVPFTEVALSPTITKAGVTENAPLHRQAHPRDAGVDHPQ